MATIITIIIGVDIASITVIVLFFLFLLLVLRVRVVLRFFFLCDSLRSLFLPSFIPRTLFRPASRSRMEASYMHKRRFNTVFWTNPKRDIQRPRMLANGRRLPEPRGAHASHGWDTSEAETRSRATAGSRVAGLTLDGGESGGNRGSIC